MIIDKKHNAAFAEYKDSLFLLEKTFILAGLPVSFHCFVTPSNNKVVDVCYENNYKPKLICIEGDSPAQAIKDVAAGVRL